MQVIRQLCDKCPSLQDAQDAMAGLKAIPGFIFGYIDPKENRPVIFVDCVDSGAPLKPGQLRVEAVAPD